MEQQSKTKKCVICGQEFEGFGNNAEPLAHGLCCDECNEKVVLIRLAQSQYTYGNATMRKHFEQEVAEYNKSHQAKVGDKIYIFEMRDEPSYTGACGIVEHIDDIGQLHGTWGGCAVVPSEDVFFVIQ